MDATKTGSVKWGEGGSIDSVTLPLDDIALARTVLVETAAAERARIRALEALVIALALGCLYLLLMSRSLPLRSAVMVTTGDLMVFGSLAVAGFAFFAFYRAAALAHAQVAEQALGLARSRRARSPSPACDPELL